MGINISVTAFGLGAVLAAIGGILLVIGYNTTPLNGDEVNGGWALIIIAVIMWGIGVFLRER